MSVSENRFYLKHIASAKSMFSLRVKKDQTVLICLLKFTQHGKSLSFICRVCMCDVTSTAPFLA